MNIIDVLIIGLILLGALQGYRRGLLTGIVNFLGSIIGFVVASMEYMKVYQWLEHTFNASQWLEPKIYKAVFPIVESQFKNSENQALKEFIGNLPLQWQKWFSGADLSAFTPKGTIEQIAHHLAGRLTMNVLYIFAFGIVFFVVITLIQLLASFILKPFGRFGGSVNRTGGFLFGALSTLTGLVVGAGFISVFLQFDNSGFSNLMAQSYFYPYLLNIFYYISKIFALELAKNFFAPMQLNNGLWL